VLSIAKCEIFIKKLVLNRKETSKSEKDNPVKAAIMDEFRNDENYDQLKRRAANEKQGRRMPIEKSV